MKYALICHTMCGLSCGIVDDKGIEPDLYSTKKEAQKELDDFDSEDWEVEEVTVDGDYMTIVETGRKFNWREGH
ncbi:MAG: hypothetical protein RPR28_06350 [Cycloclasticus sp.]